MLGIVAGIIDITPMILMKLPLSANLSAFSMWVVVGFFIATSNLKLPGALKGIIIALLSLIPSAIIIGAGNVADLVPVFIMTLILGGLLGFGIER